MLEVPIKEKWLNIILSGEKIDVYCEMIQFWTKSIIQWLGFPLNQSVESVLNILRSQGTDKALPVILYDSCGYDYPIAEVMCKLSVGPGKEEWGADPGREYFRFHIVHIVK